MSSARYWRWRTRTVWPSVWNRHGDGSTLKPIFSAREFGLEQNSAQAIFRQS